MNRLKELRLEYRYTLRQLADMSNMDHSAVSRIETGQRALSDDDIEIFTKIFDVSADYLLGLSDKKKNTNQPLVLEPSVVDFAFYQQRGITNDDQKKLIEDFIKMVTKNNG